MLGHRGCRLGITYPEISEMQARAIFEAAGELTKKKIKVFPEVMIPLVGSVKELAHQRGRVGQGDQTVADVTRSHNVEFFPQASR